MKSTEKLNELKISVDGLVFASDLAKVTLHLKNSLTIEQRTDIMSPLVYSSDSGHSLLLDWSKMLGLGHVLEHTEPSYAKFFLKIYNT